MANLEFAGYSVPLPGSPLAALNARAAAELADGAIPCACSHPETADMLSLPSGLYGCGECIRPMQVALDDQQAPVCACCGAPATRTTAWMAGSVFVLARICDSCSTAGNFVQHPN